MAEWTRASPYHETIGTHNVAAVKVLRMEDADPPKQDKRGNEQHRQMGGQLVWMFEAWRVRGRPHIWLGLYEKAADARARCEEDVE